MLPKWTDFRDVTVKFTEAEMADKARTLAAEVGGDVQDYLDAVARQQEASVFRNSRYTVTVYRQQNDQGDGFIHLSIKRNDQQPIGAERYRDFQLIKDTFMGPEHEAVELYPARSREADSSTQYHLWGFDDPTFRFPFGYDSGRFVKTPEQAGSQGSTAYQNPFEKHHPR